MDGIESITMPPALALEPIRGVSLPRSSGQEPLRELAGRSDQEKKQLAKDFESVLLTRLFDQVKASIGDWGFEEEDGASQQIQGLFWYYLAQDVADQGGFGLWQDIYQSLKDMEKAGTASESIDGKL
jgi:Rod binding domain-containing protein